MFLCVGSVWLKRLTDHFLFWQTPVELCWWTERRTAVHSRLFKIIELLRGLHVHYLTYKSTTKTLRTLWSLVTVRSYSQINSQPWGCLVYIQGVAINKHVIWIFILKIFLIAKIFIENIWLFLTILYLLLLMCFLWIHIKKIYINFIWGKWEFLDLNIIHRAEKVQKLQMRRPYTVKPLVYFVWEIGGWLYFLW